MINFLEIQICMKYPKMCTCKFFKDNSRYKNVQLLKLTVVSFALHWVMS